MLSELTQYVSFEAMYNFFYPKFSMSSLFNFSDLPSNSSTNLNIIVLFHLLLKNRFLFFLVLIPNARLNNFFSKNELCNSEIVRIFPAILFLI